ncbi:MAG TPA: Fur family transcriptional regulator [Anaerolineaceae bacterium]|jgi:Fe2+ or Zn2+ uptake regulation protein
MNQEPFADISQDWLAHLQASGYRLTESRKAVVQVVAERPYALDPAEIFIAARRMAPHLGLVTVYRTLEKLEELGLVQRVHQPDGCHAYVAAAAGHQHLLICRQCSRAEYFSGDDLSELFSNLGNERGFLIQEHWLQLYGICSQCQAAGGAG